MLHPKLPFFNNKEGRLIPDGLPRVIDSHVHIFPDKIFSSIWSWFDRHAWDRELKWLNQSSMSYENLEKVLYKSAERFLSALF